MTQFNANTTGQQSDAHFEQPLSKTEYVLQRLRQELEDGSIQPGTQIRQGDISTRYGVSATPVREALRRLEAEGRINYAPHRGATVSDMPQEDLYALYRFRAEVEKLLAELAVERLEDDSFRKIKEKHDALVEAVKSGENAQLLSRLNREFHVAIMRAGASYIADRVLMPLWKTVIPTSQSQWVNPENVQRFLGEHAEILDAIESGDATTAGKLMGDHVFGAYKERLSHHRGE